MYTTVFDLDAWTFWKAYLFPPIGGGGLALTVVIAFASVIASVRKRQLIYLVGLVPLVLFWALTGPVVLGEMRWGQSLRNAYARGECRLAEGVTRVDAEQRREGHSVDRIRVGATPLEISRFEVGPHYRDSIAFGGVLKDGVQARVWYCPRRSSATGGSGVIVRVDVRR